MAENRKNPLSGAFRDPDKEVKPSEQPKPAEQPKSIEPPKPTEDKVKKPEKAAEPKEPEVEKKPKTAPAASVGSEVEKKPEAGDKPVGQTAEDFKESFITEQNIGQITVLLLDLIDDFEGHPFSVKDDKDMEKLIESVKQVGILEPVVVIPNEKKPGRYEMVAGHRRKHAVQLAGQNKILAFVRNMDRDTAIIYMVDSNLKRENVSPMELARAYQMRSEAMRRKIGRRTKEEQAAIEASGKKPLTSDEELAQQTGKSVATVQRIKTLTKLTPELQDMVDKGKLPVNTGADIAQLPKEKQTEVAKVIDETGVVPSGAQAKQLKEENKAGTLTNDKIKETVAPTKPDKDPPLKITLTEEDLRPYFPDKRTTIPDVKRGIYEALDLRKRAIERKIEKEAEKEAEGKGGKKPSAPAR